MGNRSKRGRPDPDAPDPVGELQEASRWSGFTQQNIRWAHTPGSRTRGFRKIQMPGLGVWFAVALIVLAILGALTFVVWLPTLFFD
jgi:hypothetical protein